MFQYRGDALTIVCLSAGPMRFGQLAKAIVERCGTHMSDTQVGRCLSRLVGRGLVEHVETGDSVAVYRLTDPGRCEAEDLNFLAVALGRRRGDARDDTPPPLDWL
jgi:DNA-binding PadR family transcriptional regulator